jgi:IMP cyclohydrolase
MVGSDLGKLSEMEYPGRYILIQCESSREIVVYGITGRSPSSQARKFVRGENKMYVEPTDKETLEQGQVELLIYDYMLWDEDVIAVSNGKQTNTILDEMLENPNLPAWGFCEALNQWEYEPDAPHYTPRISGAIAESKAWLGIIYKGENGIVKEGFIVDGGEGISTYEGTNKNPLPSYEGRPFEVNLKGNIKNIAKDVWEGITQDFRVSVGVLIKNKKTKKVKTRIINKNK